MMFDNCGVCDKLWGNHGEEQEEQHIEQEFSCKLCRALYNSPDEICQFVLSTDDKITVCKEYVEFVKHFLSQYEK